MPYLMSLSPTVEKLSRMLKLTTNKQTDRQDRNNILSIIDPGYKYRISIEFTLYGIENSFEIIFIT